MNFTGSIHCESGIHCRRCRGFASGRLFRRTLVSQFSDLQEVDFRCPAGKPWIDDAFPVDPYVKHMLAEIADLPSDSDHVRLLKAMAGQLAGLYRGGGCVCRDRAAFEARIRDKLAYYWRLYGPGAPIQVL